MTCFLHEKACKGTAKKSNIQIFGQKSATFLLFSFIFRNFAPTFNKNVCMPTKERNRSIDILRAIAIILVVIGHMYPVPGCEWLQENFRAGSYRLAIFLFISGYLFRDMEWKDYGSFTLRKTRSLVLPLIGWNIVYAGIVSLINLRHPANYLPPTAQMWTLHELLIEPFVVGHQCLLNLATWFVGLLFLTLLIFGIAHLIGKKLPEWAMLLLYTGIAFLSLCCARFLPHSGIYLVLMRIGLALFFVQLGRCFRIYIEPLIRTRKLWWIIILLGLAWCISVYGKENSYIWLFFNFSGNVLRPLLAGTFGCLFWMIAAMQIAKWIPQNKVEKAISNGTWSIMTNHLLVRFMCCWAFVHFFPEYGMRDAFSNDFWFFPRSANFVSWFTVLYFAVLSLEIMLPVLWQLGFDRFKEHSRTIFRTLTNRTK